MIHLNSRFIGFELSINSSESDR